jgi:hypothetical protein
MTATIFTSKGQKKAKGMFYSFGKQLISIVFEYNVGNMSLKMSNIVLVT